MVFGRDFFWVVLQFGAWMRGPGFKIGLFGNCHAANGVSPEVFPDQFVWIAVGQECATTYGPINSAHTWNGLLLCNCPKNSNRADGARSRRCQVVSVIVS